MKKWKRNRKKKEREGIGGNKKGIEVKRKEEGKDKK